MCYPKSRNCTALTDRERFVRKKCLKYFTMLPRFFLEIAAHPVKSYNIVFRYVLKHIRIKPIYGFSGIILP